jgi:hypothetical protein
MRPHGSMICNTASRFRLQQRWTLSSGFCSRSMLPTPDLTGRIQTKARTELEPDRTNEPA